MTDKVESYIGAVVHAIEHITKKLKVVISNFRFTRTEMDGRNQVFEFDGVYFRFDNLLQFRAIPLIRLEY